MELLTSRFLYGPVPAAEGYRVDESFYRRSAARGLDAPGRRAFKAAEHLVDMLRFRRAAARSSPAAPGEGHSATGSSGAATAAAPDVIHYQWLTMPSLDALLLPPIRPRVITAHYILPPRPSRRQVAAARRVFGRMDAVIAHSEHGARRLREEVGLDPGRVHVIHHGAFDYLTRLPEERPLPPELAGGGPKDRSEDSRVRSVPADPPRGGSRTDPQPAGVEAAEPESPAEVTGPPVILFFGLLRPYKGIDTLLRAFRRLGAEAELWIAGNPRMDTAPLRRLATEAPGRVRFLERFVEDAEIPALMRRADVVVLPYRDAEHSGVLYTALAFGKPMVLSAVGGFPEVAATGAARLVPPEDPAALAAALDELVRDESARTELAEAATRAATGSYSWDEAASQTLTLYRDLLEKGG
ncbi:MAG: glycosyltransferase family 4 protein [Solirubrobacterales bacterium]